MRLGAAYFSLLTAALLANGYVARRQNKNQAIISTIGDGQMQVGPPASAMSSFGGGGGGGGAGGGGGSGGGKTFTPCAFPGEGPGCTYAAPPTANAPTQPPPSPPSESQTSSPSPPASPSSASPFTKSQPSSPAPYSPPVSTKSCTTNTAAPPPSSTPAPSPHGPPYTTSQLVYTATLKSATWYTVTPYAPSPSETSPTCKSSLSSAEGPTSQPSEGYSQSGGRPYPSPPPSSSPSSPSSGGPPGAPPGSSGQCPLELRGANYTYPHVILNMDSSQPSAQCYPSYNGTISTSGKKTAFMFDIPSEWAGKTCTMQFSLPTQDQLETSGFTMAGSGNAVFTELHGSISSGMTMVNMPQESHQLQKMLMQVGSASMVMSETCRAGQQITIMMSMEGAQGASMTYFQDYNPCPIGLFVTAQ